MERVCIALGLTLVAGMATGIGSVIAFTAKRTDYRLLSVATGFSAGVMLYVSFVEIFPESTAMLAARYGESWGSWLAAASFFGGMIIMALIDNVIPAAENPHETHSEEETAPLHDPEAAFPDFPSAAFSNSARPERGVHDHGPARAGLMRTGLLTVLAITIHNFPKALPPFWPRCRSRRWAQPLPWPSPCTTFPKASAFPSPYFTRRATAKRPFGGLSPAVFPSRWAPLPLLR